MLPFSEFPSSLPHLVFCLPFSCECMCWGSMLTNSRLSNWTVIALHLQDETLGTRWCRRSPSQYVLSPGTQNCRPVHRSIQRRCEHILNGASHQGESSCDLRGRAWHQGCCSSVQPATRCSCGVWLKYRDIYGCLGMALATQLQISTIAAAGVAAPSGPTTIIITTCCFFISPIFPFP